MFINIRCIYMSSFFPSLPISSLHLSFLSPSYYIYIYIYIYSDFNHILKTINWPITKDTSTKSLKLWQQKQSLFAATFKNLLAIDKTQDQHGTQNIPKLADPLPLPVELLLASLRKRFKFHFYGNRQTNSKEKVS